MTMPPKKTYNFRCNRVVLEFNGHLEQVQHRNQPKPRSGHRIETCDTFMYSFGGYNPLAAFFDEHRPEDNADEEVTLFKELWRYNMVTKTWKELDIPKSDFPPQLASMCTAKLGNKILVHGGTGAPFGVFNSNKCYVADINNNTLQKHNIAGPPPLAKYGEAAFLDRDNGNWYFVGGTTGTDFFMDVWCLDLVTKEWKQLMQQSQTHNIPPGRYRHEIALYEDKIIVFGGGTISTVFDFRELPVFDLKKKKWETMETHGMPARPSRLKYPRARRCHSGLQVDSENGSDAQYVITGGMNGEIAFKDVWSFNLRTRQWSQWRKLPHPLYFHDAALTPSGKMILFGGIIPTTERVDEFGERTNEVLGCWVKVPKLTEMTWEALLHYVPALPKMTVEYLSSIGIPRQFLDRLR